MREEALPCQREHFSLPPGAHYLNCAYASPLMRSVEAAAVEALQRLRAPGTIHAEDFFRPAETVRERFARLINAPDPDGVAIIPSVSYGIAIAARNTPIGRGQNVVVAEGQFPSNVYAWQRLVRERGAVLRVVPKPDADGGNRSRRWTERILEAIDRRTAAVALGTVDWTDGTLFDLEAIGERARAVDAVFVLDGIQSIGAMPFDVQRVQPDALVCAAYKWLLGPMGIGLAYLGARLRSGIPLEETWLGRSGSEEFHRLTEHTETYQPGARRFDMGGRASFVLLPMLSAALAQLLEWGPERIQRYCAELVAPIRPELASLGVAMDDPGVCAAHLFALRPWQMRDVGALHQALDRHRVFVSVRGESLRVSPHVYNTSDDLAALVEVLQRLGGADSISGGSAAGLATV